MIRPLTIAEANRIAKITGSSMTAAQIQAAYGKRVDDDFYEPNRHYDPWCER